MSYSTAIIFFSITLATVFAGPRGPGGPGGFGGPGGRGRHGPPMPPFLQNVTDEGRQAFFDIMRNQNLTIADMESQTATWAQTYGVSDIYTQFEANMTAHKNEVQQNVTQVVSQLSAAQTALESVMNNKNQTRQQMKEAIDNLKTQYPQEIPALFFISGQFRRGPMGPMGPGGRRGGPGGRRGGDSGEMMGMGGGRGMRMGGGMGGRRGPDSMNESSDNMDF
ncbi:hypothetical protein B9Z55_015334 [Caenorhabditis nigoni]|uniref:SXP/RAL-2 family protein Ani s 5-like cation-binding domain-containing protein n=1 Tax=Caenorhabditis nigoni TaxID=1611254 RepID=A0A2G5U9P5_9PELO|nr:hypothetical protein B9Z55_015334 [Caenorhabditis nigoni]